MFEISRDFQSEKVSSGKTKILVVNGPNLNMLGLREPEIYGKRTYSELVDFIGEVCAEKDVEAEIVQSNHEGVIVDVIHEFVLKNRSNTGKSAGIVINPAAYTHTSVAILDALKLSGLPCAEVHLSDINSREDFRKVSYTSQACGKTFAGLGFEGYKQAIGYILEILN
ncbi:MAG: 3-dehydroquinate dehydratase [Oscillospiraceae bacterium]|nr:3-dehydroquinate dehydratase [Oscillospiraceae bacterium]